MPKEAQSKTLLETYFTKKVRLKLFLASDAIPPWSFLHHQLAYAAPIALWYVL